MAPLFVVFEGIIGAGKSTLLPLVAEALRAEGKTVTVVPEPVGKWKQILASFYRDPQRYAMSFQLLAYATRSCSIRAALQTSPPPDIVLLERCSESDRMFMEMFRGAIEPVEMEIHSAVCDEVDHGRVFDPQDACVVFLDPDVTVCMQRVKARGRPAEISLSASYQARLQRAHSARFFGTDADEFPQLAARPAPPTLLHLKGNEVNCDFHPPSGSAQQGGTAVAPSVGVVKNWVLGLEAPKGI